MKFLITGCAGFMGSEITRQLVKKGYEVIGIDALTYAGDMTRLLDQEEKITFYHSNICVDAVVDQLFRNESPDIVIHTAAESHVDRSLLNASVFIDTNVKGTQILLEAARKYGVERFINISTDEVYGELGYFDYFDESSPLNPNSPYSVSKAAADMLGRSYQRSFGVPVITVRPCNNFGIWQYPEKLIPVVIYKAFHDKSIPLYGKGNNIREWLPVYDCANAIIQLAMIEDPEEVYNIGSGKEYENIEVLHYILDHMKKSYELIDFVEDRPGHDFRYALDCTKLQRTIEWEPISFVCNLHSVIDWYVSNMEWVEEKVEYLIEYWSKVYGNRSSKY